MSASTPDASEVLGRDVTAALLEALAAARDPHAVLARAIELRGPPEPDPLISAAVEALGRPRARVSAVAAELGLSARELQRRVGNAIGYGPKMLQRVKGREVLLVREEAVPAIRLREKVGLAKGNGEERQQRGTFLKRDCPVMEASK